MYVIWSRHRDLNSGPLPYHGSALPLSYDGTSSITGVILAYFPLFLNSLAAFGEDIMIHLRKVSKCSTYHAFS